MWSVVCLCLLVTSTIAKPDWRQKYEYDYMVRGRTLTSLHEVSNQYAGIIFKATLKVQPRNDEILQAQLSQAYYSQVHSRLDNGWGTHIPESEISWKNLPISSKPFQIHMNKGEITGLTVSDELEYWEINMIKGIVSQFQLKTNERPDSSYERGSSTMEEDVLSTFTVMEETITGETATFYRVNTVPEHLIPTYPTSESIWKEKTLSNVFEITKHKNYNMSAELPSYHYGFAGLENGRPSSNRMGSFFTRGSFGRAIITGDVNKYTIQNSFTVSEILVSPTLMEKQKGSAYSMVNVTLKNIEKSRDSIEEVSNPLRLNSLVYSQEDLEDYSEETDAKLRMSRFKSSKDRFSRKSSRFVVGEEEVHEEGLMIMYTGSNKVSRQEKMWLIQKVKDLTKEIAEEIQDPYTMLLKATMNKFTNLNTLVRFLNANELKQIADEFYEAGQDSGHDAWKIFRDSVAVSGTEPALLVIKKWIESSRIENAEAALLVSTMAKTVRQPSIEYLKQFFELAKDEKVMSEWPLNDTAILSFSQFVRQVFIDEKQSAAQFSGKTLKKIRFPEGIEFIKQRVIPFFTEQLHSAIDEAKTHKIHVYIRVLGNIAHPQILVAFKPYLNGEKQVSQYQRLLMTMSMDKLAELYPEHARAVLLRLYQNMGENQPVRAVAVFQIMRTRPSVELLQYMASYTNVDKHNIVNAAVKSAIESAAELKGEEFYQIRQAAEAAKPVLTKKIFGIQHGGSYLHHHLVEELKIHFRDNMETVGSEDQFCPRGIKYSLQYNMGGLKSELVNLQTVVSNIDELVNVFKKQTESYSQKQMKQERNYQQQAQQKWSSQYIAQLLQYKPDEREQLEGSFYLENGILQGMLPFDNTTIPHIRKTMKDWEEELAEGKQINFVKMNSEKDVRIGLPTEMGFLFVYTYETPSMLRIRGSVKAMATPRISQEKFKKPESVQIETDLTMTMTSKIQGRLSVVTPFDKKQYSSGYDKHAQVHLPMKGNFQWDLETKQIRADIETQNSGEETRLLHYSTWPYTTIIDNKKYEPASLQSDTKIIKQEGLRSYENVVGRKQLGLALRIQVEHERELLDVHQLRKLVSEHGLTVGLMNIWNEAKIQYSHVNVTHVENDSPTKKLVIRLASKQEYRADQSMANSQQQDVSNARLPEERLTNSIEKVSANIKNSKRESYDLSLECQGDKEIKYTLTGAYAKSDIDPMSRIYVHARKESNMQGEKPYSVSFEAESLIENTEELLHQHSWDKDPKMESRLWFSFGHDSEDPTRVQAEVKFQRSEEREQYLKQQPSFRQCDNEMKQGDYAVPACQNVSMELNLFDHVQARIKYENIPQQVEEALKTIYYTTRYHYYPNTEVDSKQNSDRQDEITLEGAFEHDLRSVNVSVKTSEEKFTLKNVPVSDITKRFVVVHPVHDARSRLMALAQGSEIYRPSCVVGARKISTFLQSVYPADISDKWTVMFQFLPKQARQGSKLKNIQDQLEHQTENYAILVKKASQSEMKEVKMTLSTPETEFKVLDITLSPESDQDGVRVTVNSDEVSVKGDETFQYGDGYIQIYEIAEDQVKVEVRDQFYVIYDRKAIKLSLLNGKFKDAVRGICGQFNDKRFEDFRSPSDCFVRDKKQFIESYEVEGTQGKDTREMLFQDGNECVRTEEVHVKVVPTFDDEEVSEDCTKYQTKYVEENGEVCFTLRPMPVCSRSCQASSLTERDVPVHCIKKSRVGHLWKSQIDNGGSPDFSHKSETKTVLLQIPQNCY